MDKTRAYNLDCLPAMREFPDKYFDLAIVDPPYGIDINMNMGVRKYEKRKHESKSWDEQRPSDWYFAELNRICKNRIIWGGNFFTDFLFPTSGWIFWDKMISGDVEFSNGELAWTSFEESLKKISIRVQSAHIHGERIHPTQKPIALYKWLLKNYAKEGDKILDTHLGSGSSRIAAFDMGFDFTGYELDESYFIAAEERFNRHKSQLKLFDVDNTLATPYRQGCDMGDKGTANYQGDLLL